MAATPKARTFEELYEDEKMIQSVTLDINNAAPPCRTVFDKYMSCLSLRSRLKNLHIHGENKGCDDVFDEWKFCMSIMGRTKEEREDAWIERRATEWANRRVGPSSEDIYPYRKFES